MSDKEKTPKVKFVLLDPNSTSSEALAKLEKVANREMSPLEKSIINILDGDSDDSITRLAFEKNPLQYSSWASVYEPKLTLIPDKLLKRIAIQDSLVAAIVKARSSHVSAFGHIQEDRFSTGFRIVPRAGVMEKATDEQKEALQEKINRAARRLEACGLSEGYTSDEQMNFSTYLEMVTRDGVIVGRFATEIIWTVDVQTGEKKFHSFRPVDAATIYRAVKQKSAVQRVREEAYRLLKQIAGDEGSKIIPEKFMEDEYAYVQVIDGQPVQAFTADEMIVTNLYPVTDVDLNGYPLTPIDTVIADITTHINITTHNKLYFQSGRATRGMLVIKSNDIDPSVINDIRQQFNASINSVSNAWRMPVFGVSQEDDVVWQAIDTAQRDMEFQYLSDTNARVILSAFQMSPEELPGYAHLSRGTNNQALSESNNEYKLQAARDVGIRPLLSKFQDFLNDRILPLIDPEVARLCVLQLAGLDADSPEKETTRLQQDAMVHMTYSEILERVEKEPIPKEYGGRFPLNPQYQAIIEKYLTFGEIQEYFFGKKDASKDPNKQFYQNPMFFQWLQFQMQMQQFQMQMQQFQMAQQQMMMQQEAMQQQAAGMQAQAGVEEPPPEEELPPPEEETSEEEGDIVSGVDQLLTMLAKSEKNMPINKKKLIAQHTLTVKRMMEKFQKESQQMLAELTNLAIKHKKD